MQYPDVTLSVVSHGQIALVVNFLKDLRRHCSDLSVEVVLTLNIPEEVPDDALEDGYSLVIVRNPTPLGFGANHNKAFLRATAPVFCVVNPDVRIGSNIFPRLIESLQMPAVGVVAPLIIDAAGNLEDSARKFPTPLTILGKLLGMVHGVDYVMRGDKINPDWIGGMFMVFRRQVFQEVKGFDERYFLYYEDVDLCARMRLRGMAVVLDPSVRAVHDARRSSHSNPHYSFIHVRSMFRFLLPSYSSR